MEFKSVSHKHKMYELAIAGKVNPETVMKMETPKDLPEKVATKIPKKFLKY